MSDTTTDDATTDDVEARARELGWKSAEEWVGDTSNHMPADKFLETQEKLLAKADAAAQKRIKALNGELHEVRQTLNDLGSHLKKADERAYQRALKDVQKRMDAAAMEGDADAYTAGKAELDDIQKEMEEAVKATDKPKPDTPAVNPDAQKLFDDWQEKNPWYGLDGDLDATVWADSIAGKVAEKHQGEAFYAELTRRVQNKFPELFGDQTDDKRRKPAAVEGASGGGGGGKTLWDQVDKEGKDAFHRFVKQGLFKDTKEDREKYASDWGAEA